MWMKHPDIARRWTKEYGSKIVPNKKQRSAVKRKLTK